MRQSANGDFLQWLLTFLQVAETGGVHRAAAIHCLSPSAASLHVKKLEQDLGVELFTRQSRGMALTEAGRQLKDESVPILEGVERLRSRKFSDAAISGVIRITCVNRMVLRFIDDILEFRRLYPEVRVNVDPASPRRVFRGIEDGGFDLALGIHEQLPGTLVFTPLGPSSAFLYTPPGNPYGLPPEPTWDEICDLPLIALTVEGYANPVVAVLPEMPQPRNVVVAVTDFLLALHLVRSGFGACIAPPLTPLEPAADYTVFNIDHIFPIGVLGIITRRERYFSPQAKAFIDFLVSRHDGG